MTRALSLFICIFAGVAAAQEGAPQDPTEAIAADVAAEDAPVPWRGSSISLTSQTSAVSFDESAELTYNPYSALSLTVAPRWYFLDDYFARASFSLTHEFTEADGDTFDNETLASDTTLGVGGRFGEIPGAGIVTSGTLDLRLPTSKPSQAASMMFAVTPAVRLNKTFRSLANLSVGAAFSATRFEHEYTTRQILDNSGRCSSAGGTCEPFLHTGVRNPRWRLSAGASLGVAPLKWLSFRVTAAVIQDLLHDDIETEAENPHDQFAGTDTRELMSYGVSGTAEILTGLSFTLGANTTNPQLQPAGGYYRPFFNRFTLVTADLTYSFGS